LFAIPMSINTLLGPACACNIRTAVQQEELPSLNRLRRARRVFDRIRPGIIAAQGQLAPGEIPDRLRAAVAAPSGEPTFTGAPAPAPAIAPEPPPAGP